MTTQFWNTNSSQCVTRYTNVEGPCFFDYQCQFNVNLTCDLRDNLCKCQIANQYWSTTLKKCLTYGNYSDSCNSTNLCNINQVNLTCFTTSSSVWNSDNSRNAKTFGQLKPTCQTTAHSRLRSVQPSTSEWHNWAVFRCLGYFFK